MPIRVQNDLPVKEILEKENIFVMDEHRATHQDIRPIKIGLLNLMPLKEDTELQILRSLSNTPLQVDVSFVTVSSHQSKNTPTSHLNKFYQKFNEIKNQKFDGFIITGAPVELSLIHILVGFLDGIDESLKEPNPIETMDENTEVSLAFDKEKLYKNMVAAKADWLYELPQWKEIYSEEELKKLYKEQKESTTIRKEKKIGRNDPCPCGSGKKYKKCCGR